MAQNYVVRIFRQHGQTFSGETVNALNGKKTPFNNADELLATLEIQKSSVKKIQKTMREKNEHNK